MQQATLFRGIKQLHLMLPPPYDITEPGENQVRDDLIGVKVWISTTAGFTPDPNAAIDFAANSSIILNDLAVNTRYYVRYAFISKIEPAVYTISNQLTAKTYDELTTVYGELSNDPLYLSREPDSLDLDWTVATGTFRVWEYSMEVTGNGVVYAIVPNSATNGLVATIDPVTGVFSATGWTEGTRNARISFSATYAGITVIRDWNIVDGVGQDAPQITLTVTPDTFVYLNSTAKLAQTPKIRASAEVFNITGDVTFEVKAYDSDGAFINNVAFTTLPPVVGEPKTIEITNQQFHLNDGVSYIIIKAAVGPVYDQDTVPRLNNGTNEITIDVDNPVVQIQASENGVVDPDEYNETGTKITVYEGATKLAISNSGSQDPNTWAVGTWDITTIQGFGIIPDNDWTEVANSIIFGSHSNMSQDTAYIEYTITYKTLAGYVDERVVRQNFAKSKQGFPGTDAPIVTIKGAQAFVRPADKPDTDIAPAYIDVIAATSNITSPTFSWRVDGVLQANQTNSTFRINKFSNVTSKVIRVDVVGTNTQGEPITQFDEHTVYFVDSGDSAVVAFCNPEFSGISCDSQGIPDNVQFPFYITTTVLRGSEVLSNTTAPGTIVYALEFLDGIASNDISINQTTGVVTVADITGTFSSFNVKFTVSGGPEPVVISKTVRLNKILEGDSAPSVRVTATNQIFVKTKNTGVLTPSLTSITATPINVPNPEYTWTIDNVAQPQFNNDAQIEINAFEGNPKVVKCQVTSSTDDDISVFDSLTLYSVKEGDDAVVFGITNENQTLTADKDGVLVAGQYPITSELVVLRGATRLVPPNVTYSILSQTGTDSTKVSITGSVLTIASGGITADFAEIELQATIGALQLVKVLTLSKSKEGQPGIGGAAGKTVTIAQSAPAHEYNTSGLLPTPATQTLTANTYNVTATTVFYEFLVDGVSQQNTTSNTYVYTPRSSYVNMPDLITVKVREGTNNSTVVAEDSVTIVGIKAGSDAVVVWLENPAHTLSTTAAGVVDYTGSGTIIRASEGNDILEASAALAANGTFRVSADGTDITPSSSITYGAQTVTYGDHRDIVDDSARITYTVEVKTSTGVLKTFVIYQNLAKSKEGQVGAQNANVLLYARNSSPTAPSFSPPVGLTYNFTTGLLSASITNWTQTIPAATQGSVVWVRQAVATSAPGSNVSNNTLTWSTATILAEKGDKGDKGDDGVSITGPTGLSGIVQRIGYQLVSQTATNPPTYTASTSGGATFPGANWSGTVPTATVGNVVWYIYGQYNPNSVAHEGIAANTTVWSAPIAASIFQDIRSDNWNGNNPPTGGTFGGTAGYYLNKSEGSIYVQQAYVRGTLIAGSVISDTVTLSTGVTLATVASNASNALSGLSSKLDKQSTYVLGTTGGTNEISLKTSGYDAGNGIIITNTGILGKKANDTTFAIDNAGNATFKGDITGSSGNFIGTLTVGTGNTVFKVNSDGSIQSGHATFASAPFRVTNTGAITATSATITGTLAAGSVISDSVTLSSGTSLGTISSNASSALSGLTSKLDKLSTYILGTTAGTNEISLKTSGYDAGNGIIITNTGILGKKANDTTFAIDNAGNATFKGDITGSSGNFIGTLTVGTGNTVFKVNSDGSIQSGHATFASAPFRVTNTGAITATSATITGTLAAGSVISDSVTLSSGTSLGTISSNASSALSGLTSKLDKLSTYILGTTAGTNEISLKTSGYDAGNGIIITNTGILGKKANDTTFAIDNAGNATFKGDITGSSGNFIGSVIVGSTPAISGTTMTGNGAIINNTGTFALGNSTTNITFNGTTLSLNGQVVNNSNIAPNTITVDKITSGATAANQNGGIFALGDTSSVLGFKSVIAAKQFTYDAWALLGTQEGVVGGGVVGATTSSTASGVVGVNVTDNSYNSLRTLGALGWGTIGVIGRYLRNIGTPNNNGDTPLNQGNIGTSTATGQFIWYGSSGNSAVTQAHLATGSYAIEVVTGDTYLRKTIASASSKTIELANANYALQVTQGDSYLLKTKAANAISSPTKEVEFANANYSVQVLSGDTYLLKTKAANATSSPTKEVEFANANHTIQVLSGTTLLLNTRASSFGVGTDASGTAGEIRATDNITAYYSSDARLKENIKDIDNALDKVSKIGGKTFNWTQNYIDSKGGADGYFVQKDDFGVIAQDVQKHFPLATRTRQDGHLAVDYEKLCALAFQAIKELKEEVDELKSRLQS